MSLIKDINDLHLSVKSITIGLVLLMPFWYLNIYLLAPWYVEKAPIQLPIIIAFCLSVGWLMTSMLFSYSLFLKVAIQQKVYSDQENYDHPIYLLSVIIALCALMPLSFVAYTFKWSLWMLVYASFLATAITTIIALIRYFSIKAKWDKEKKAEVDDDPSNIK